MNPNFKLLSNTYFQFKKFTLQQDSCAMKVCTDACLFGAWSAAKIKKQSIHSILDIGTGTGLLSLMLAQKNDAIIHAVEADVAAANQALQNFTSSPFSARLQVFACRVQDYRPERLYDFIICNPPFFDNDLKSNQHQRNLALHSTDLSLEELLQNMQRLVTDKGLFSVLLPYHRSLAFEKMAAEIQFHWHHKVTVRQTEKHTPFRSMLLFGKLPGEAVEKEIIIKINNQYSPEFIALLADYYLYL